MDVDFIRQKGVRPSPGLRPGRKTGTSGQDETGVVSGGRSLGGPGGDGDKAMIDVDERPAAQLPRLETSSEAAERRTFTGAAELQVASVSSGRRALEERRRFAGPHSSSSKPFVRADPFAYLDDILRRLPYHPAERVVRSAHPAQLRARGEIPQPHDPIDPDRGQHPPVGREGQGADAADWHPQGIACPAGFEVVQQDISVVASHGQRAADGRERQGLRLCVSICIQLI
jgi:hypothetical protein